MHPDVWPLICSKHWSSTAPWRKKHWADALGFLLWNAEGWDEGNISEQNKRTPASHTSSYFPNQHGHFATPNLFYSTTQIRSYYSGDTTNRCWATSAVFTPTKHLQPSEISASQTPVSFTHLKRFRQPLKFPFTSKKLNLSKQLMDLNCSFYTSLYKIFSIYRMRWWLKLNKLKIWLDRSKLSLNLKLN